MSPATLPKTAAWLIWLTIMVLTLAWGVAIAKAHLNSFEIVLAFLVSGFLADAFTGLAHFCFDYVFPYHYPIVGPISSEFNEHHHEPTLDPSNYVENLTKGAYASFPCAVVTLAPCLLLEGPRASFVEFVMLGMATWALFFHQIHSYAHMGSTLDPAVFNAKLAEIAGMTDKRRQRMELRALFETVPIPRVVRVAQRLGLMLNPERHNIHHVSFESDFSSVNGWSDPLLNLVFRPIARRCKARRSAVAAPPHAQGALLPARGALVAE